MALEDRIDRLEADVKAIASVASAVADDTLRVCLLLQELESGGYLPNLPWDLATAMVELHHAWKAKEHGDRPADGTTIEERIRLLEMQIRDLRDTFRRKAHAQESG